MLTTFDLKNKIILELLFSGKISVGQTINYDIFQSLHSDYQYLSEVYFANILDINYNNFLGCKCGYHNVIILKNIPLALFNEIIENLIKKGIIYYNQKIDYPQFLNILDCVPFLNENTLATLLGISTSRLQHLRYGQCKTTTVLTKYDISKEEELIITQLIDKKLIYPGMQITYDHFKKLHKLFPNIKESRFAYILEMKSSTFSNMKNGLIKQPIVLKSKINSFIEMQKEEIVEFLIKSRGVQLKECINKDRFSELYKGFEYISEANFAKIILGINYNTFRSLKSNNKKANILKSKSDLTDKICENLFHNILDIFHLNEGDYIDYEIFCSIENFYKESLTKDELCKILGIESAQFLSLKYNGAKARVINGVTREKVNFIKKVFSESRFYSREEIDSVIQEYGITCHEFIVHLINNRQFFITDDYREALEKNQGLFIGKATIDPRFFNDEYDNIKRQLNYIWYSILLIGGKKEKDDIFQDLMLYIYQNCGDLYYNFSNSQIFFNKMKNRAKKYIMGRLRDLSKENPTIMQYSLLEEKKSLDKYLILQDQNVNVENETINLVTGEEKIYEHLLSILEQGGTLEECLSLLENSDIGNNPISTVIKRKISINKS